MPEAARNANSKELLAPVRAAEMIDNPTTFSGEVGYEEKQEELQDGTGRAGTFERQNKKKKEGKKARTNSNAGSRETDSWSRRIGN